MTETIEKNLPCKDRIRRAIWRCKAHTAAEKLILLYLADYGGRCKTAALAEAAGITRRGAIKIINRLVCSGIVFKHGPDHCPRFALNSRILFSEIENSVTTLFSESENSVPASFSESENSVPKKSPLYTPLNKNNINLFINNISARTREANADSGSVWSFEGKVIRLRRAAVNYLAQAFGMGDNALWDALVKQDDWLDDNPHYARNWLPVTCQHLARITGKETGPTAGGEIIPDGWPQPEGPKWHVGRDFSLTRAEYKHLERRYGAKYLDDRFESHEKFIAENPHLLPQWRKHFLVFLEKGLAK